MPNPFFNLLGGNTVGGMNPMALLSQLQSNPLAILRKAGFNVPSGATNPQSIIQYLMNSGQVTQEQLTNAQAMAQNFNFR